MNATTKLKWKRTIHSSIQATLSIGSLYLLRAGLHIHSQPFSFEDGWQPFVCWLVIFSGLSGLFRWPLPSSKRVVQPVPDLDPYTLAQAELLIERASRKA